MANHHVRAQLDKYTDNELFFLHLALSKTVQNTGQMNRSIKNIVVVETINVLEFNTRESIPISGLANFIPTSAGNANQNSLSTRRITTLD